MLRPKPLLRGLLSYVPPVYRRVVPQRTGGTGMAAYCYEVWLKHLVLLHANGMVAYLHKGTGLGDYPPVETVLDELSRLLTS